MRLSDEARAWYLRICEGQVAPGENPPQAVIEELTPPGGELISKGHVWHESSVSMMFDYRRKLESKP